jgi:hypothetical protein
VVGEDDLLLAIDHQKALGKGIEGLANARRHGTRRVQIAQNFRQIQIESSKPDTARKAIRSNKGLSNTPRRPVSASGR